MVRLDDDEVPLAETLGPGQRRLIEEIFAHYTSDGTSPPDAWRLARADYGALARSGLSDGLPIGTDTVVGTLNGNDLAGEQNRPLAVDNFEIAARSPRMPCTYCGHLHGGLFGEYCQSCYGLSQDPVNGIPKPKNKPEWLIEKEIEERLQKEFEEKIMRKPPPKGGGGGGGGRSGGGGQTGGGGTGGPVRGGGSSGGGRGGGGGAGLFKDPFGGGLWGLRKQDYMPR